MTLSHEDVREILRIIDESDLTELRIETPGFSLYVAKGEAGGGAASPLPRDQRGGAEGASPPAPHEADGKVDDGEPAGDGLITIPSPMLGTFYRAEAPGSAPFVDVGAEIEPDTTVCIIEVMKMMNSVSAGVSGEVAEVCGSNGQLVEYGEPLFRVKPR